MFSLMKTAAMGVGGWGRWNKISFLSRKCVSDSDEIGNLSILMFRNILCIDRIKREMV